MSSLNANSPTADRTVQVLNTEGRHEALGRL
jgi:hypothetical protein